jgi:hypothetical protein
MITILGYITLTGIGVFLLYYSIWGLLPSKIKIIFGGTNREKIIGVILLVIAVGIFVYLGKHISIRFIPD